MISKLGNLFLRNKSESDSYSDSNIRALTETPDPPKIPDGVPLRHSWTSSNTISFIQEESKPEPDLSEELQSLNEDELLKQEEEQQQQPQQENKPRRPTIADKFIDWLQRDKKKQEEGEEKKEIDIESQPKTKINILEPKDFDNSIIDNYTPKIQNSKVHYISKEELEKLEQSYRPNHTKQHMEECFHLFSENLIESFHCSIWIDDNVYLGECHLTENFICFDSKPNAICKFIIPLKAIKKIEIATKEKTINKKWFLCETVTKPPLNSIHILCNCKHFFFFGFPESQNQQEKCYNSIIQLIDNNQNIELIKPDDINDENIYPLSSSLNHSPLLLYKESSSSSSLLDKKKKKKKQKQQINQKINEKQKKFENQFLQTEFPHSLPIQEILSKKCNLVREIHHIGVGIFYISQHCLCFSSNINHHDENDEKSSQEDQEKLQNNEWICVTIPFIDIFKIEKVDKDTAIEIHSNGNQIYFFLSNIHEIYEKIIYYWKKIIFNNFRDLTGLWGIKQGIRNQEEIKKRQNDLFLNENSIKNSENLILWNKYFLTHGNGCEIIKEPEIINFIHCYGVPHEYRGYIWQLASGSIQRLKMFGSNEISRLLEYENLKNDNNNNVKRSSVSSIQSIQSTSSVSRKEIEKDLLRSLPNHPHFAAGGLGIQELRRVLCAYAIRNPDIGYCQSMNIVCAVFLLFMSEEEVFWLLTVVAEKLLPEYYSSPLIGLMTDQKILQILVDQEIPGIVNHLLNLGITLSIITMPWFLCLFINFLPWSATFRILDEFFLDGPVILFRTSLAILYIEKDNILKQNDGIELFNLTKRVSVSPDKIFEVKTRFFICFFLLFSYFSFKQGYSR